MLKNAGFVLGFDYYLTRQLRFTLISTTAGAAHTTAATGGDVETGTDENTDVG